MPLRDRKCPVHFLYKKKVMDTDSLRSKFIVVYRSLTVWHWTEVYDTVAIIILHRNGIVGQGPIYYTVIPLRYYPTRRVILHIWGKALEGFIPNAQALQGNLFFPYTDNRLRYFSRGGSKIKNFIAHDSISMLQLKK